MHYESLHPVADTDIEKTKWLVQRYISGKYEYSKKDIPYLISSEEQPDDSSLAFSFSNLGNTTYVHIRKDFKLFCPSCKKPFVRLKSHLSTPGSCNKKIDMKTFEVSLEIFNKSKKKVRRARNTSDKMENVGTEQCNKKLPVSEHSWSQALRELQNQARHELGSNLDEQEISWMVNPSSENELILNVHKVCIMVIF